jgi:hypothetical protein
MKRLTTMFVGIAASSALALTLHASQETKTRKAAKAPEKTAAKDVCYDFSDLPEKDYRVGDVIPADKAEIQLKEFLGPAGNPSQADQAQKAVPVNTTFANGKAPELRMYLINAKVVPEAPLKKVTLKFAQNAGSQLVNFEVNGDRRVETTGLPSLNGKVVGGSAVIVNVNPSSTSGNHPGGTLEIHSTAEKIKNFGIGGVQLYVDRVCMVR